MINTKIATATTLKMFAQACCDIFIMILLIGYFDDTNIKTKSHFANGIC
jgi:hypothetical protein